MTRTELKEHERCVRPTSTSILHRPSVVTVLAEHYAEARKRRGRMTALGAVGPSGRNLIIDICRDYDPRKARTWN